MKIISKNRRAYHDYSIEDKLEAGIVLKGPEVKSLRAGKASLAEAYAKVEAGEAWLLNFYIPSLQQASYMNVGERRDRKLLLKEREIKQLERSTTQKGYTIVPLKIYFNEANLVKVEIGLGKGKAKYDKRQALKDKDQKRQAEKAMRR